MTERLPFLFWVIGFSAVAGCSTLSPFVNQSALADQIAESNGFKKSFVKSHPFILTTYYKLQKPSDPLTVYIEGDGFAWVTASRPSEDPTPHDPLVLELASKDRSQNVLYLARPGQYGNPQYPSGTHAISSEFWTNKRFSEEVISSMNQAIQIFVKKADARAVHLIGYSGGAAVAVLIAGRRSDVRTLRTIAGHLDSDALSRHHGTSPLEGSLNPIGVARLLAKLPQVHFVGEEDKVVPPFIARLFADKVQGDRCVHIISLQKVTHTTGWRERWPDLLGIPVDCG